MSDRPTPETDAEWNPPFSYDVYADGAHQVGVLANPEHTQGAWVEIEDYRCLERERDELLKALEELLAASLRFPSCHVISNQQQRRLDIACRSAEVAFLAAVKGGQP